MEVISIEESKKTPAVYLSVAEKRFEIKGRSMPEDATEFYEPIIEWLKKYAENPQKGINLEVRLDYFNTSSSKLILEIFKLIESLDGHKIKWYYHLDDEDMLDAGEDFHYIIGDAIQLVRID
jgi:hypothetical protein